MPAPGRLPTRVLSIALLAAGPAGAAVDEAAVSTTTDAAMPQVVAWQAIVARQVDITRDPAVVIVGTINGGVAVTALLGVAGREHVQEVPLMTAAEDFAHFGEQAPPTRRS